MDGRGTILAA